jgi:A/G-specific adenine glycosylase
MDFTKLLLSWYNRNHRDLPWRRTQDPYKIWISEIVLQQTRIEQGRDYYLRFLDRFPGISDLASADEKEVLKLWQGLGYYSRARNLHHAAKEIGQRFNGEFPSDYEEIHGLKGIGDYTAAAIASIAYNLPYPVIDGNVLRFFSRYFGVKEPIDKASGKKKILQLANEKMDRSDPGKFNQAIMEFGALQCKPGSPNCSVCPFNRSCFAFTHGKVDVLPVKSRANLPRKRYFNFLVMVYVDSKKRTTIYLRKREENDIWKNLYDFPLIETSSPVSREKLMNTLEWKKLVQSKTKTVPERSKVYQHILSHQLIFARFYILQLEKKPVNKFIPVNMKDLDRFPVPRLIEKFISSQNF